MTAVDPADESADATAPGPAPWRWWRRVLHELIPTPRATPFTFCYGLVLIATALYADFGDEATVNQLLRDSSTDAAHLADRPLVVLVASALWIAGGWFSFYGLAFAPILGALERRVGGLRTVAVFLLGHVLATLATELPVAGAVAAGSLPAASLHRLDYGISFGLMACLGALAGLLSHSWKWTLLSLAALMCAQDLIEFADPLASWGHPIALLTGVACQVLLRDSVRGPWRHRPGRSGTGQAVPPPVRAAALPGQGDPAGDPQQAAAGGPTGVDAGEEAVEGGEAGSVGAPPGVPDPVGGVTAADGGGEERRRDADALQPR